MLKVEGKSIKDFFIETLANTTRCIRVQYTFQSDRIGLSRTYATHRIKSNKLLLGYHATARIPRQQTDIRAGIRTHLCLRHKSRRYTKRQSGKCHEIIRRYIARFPSSREREKSSFSTPAGIIIHLRETPDRAEEDPRPEFGVASPEIFSPREDCEIEFGEEGQDARRFDETKFRNGFLGNQFSRDNHSYPDSRGDTRHREQIRHDAKLQRVENTRQKLQIGHG